ncbi:MAG: hypothetical protein ACE3JP_06595 [Ectobacillus sp.]
MKKTIIAFGLTCFLASGAFSVLPVQVHAAESKHKQELKQLEAQQQQLQQQLWQQRETNRKLLLQHSGLTKEEKARLEDLHNEMNKLHEEARALHEQLAAAKAKGDETSATKLKEQLRDLHLKMKEKRGAMKKMFKSLKVKQHPSWHGHHATRQELRELYMKKRELYRSMKRDGQQNQEELLRVQKQIIEKQKQLLKQAQELEKQLR